MTGFTFFVFVCKTTFPFNRQEGAIDKKTLQDEEDIYFKAYAHLPIRSHEHGDERKND